MCEQVFVLISQRCLLLRVCSYSDGDPERFIIFYGAEPPDARRAEKKERLYDYSFEKLRDNAR